MIPIKPRSTLPGAKKAAAQNRAAMDLTKAENHRNYSDVLFRMFDEVRKNQNVSIERLQDVQKPDAMLSDAKTESVRWLLQDARFDDLTPQVMNAFRLAAAKMEENVEDLGLPLERAYFVNDLLRREPITQAHSSGPVKRGTIDQMALIFHVYRIGGSSRAIREMFVHSYTSSLFDDTRRIVRDFYVIIGVTGGVGNHWNELSEWQRLRPAHIHMPKKM